MKASRHCRLRGLRGLLHHAEHYHHHWHREAKKNKEITSQFFSSLRTCFSHFFFSLNFLTSLISILRFLSGTSSFQSANSCLIFLPLRTLVVVVVVISAGDVVSICSSDIADSGAPRTNRVNPRSLDPYVGIYYPFLLLFVPHSASDLSMTDFHIDLGTTQD